VIGRIGGTGDGGARRFLIATAVSRYDKHPAWNRPALVGARERVIELFTGRLGYRHQTALGMDPTKLQLTDHLRAFCTSDERREDDLLAVYVSGHGHILEDGGEHVLLLSDTDPADLSYTSLKTRELADVILRETRIRRLLLMVDTCYAGQGGNELAGAALERIGAGWRSAEGSGLVIVSSAQPHQQADAGMFPHLLTEAVGSLATAGHGPDTLAVPAVVQHMNGHPDRPGYQHMTLTQTGLGGEPPPFFRNPRHDRRLTGVDLAVQQAAGFEEEARRRDTELTTRLLVRAMAYHGSHDVKSWWFSGRRTALAHLARWLNGPAENGARPVRVVTAGPGSGKTAVLGLIATLTHPERRPTVPLDTLALTLDLLPRQDTVDVAVYAQNLTDDDVLRALSAAAGIHATTVGELHEALQNRGRPFTALIDALDEAATPTTLCSRVLRPLIDHADGRIRLLLGTRPYLLDRLGISKDQRDFGGPVIDLDHFLYADPQGLRTYAARNLLEAHRASPYRDNLEALGPVADAITEAAGTSFLVARITAGTLAAADHTVPDPYDRVWRATLPKLPSDAMRNDLARLGEHTQRAVDLLRPLAYAEGQGLPWEDIWAPLASAISGRTYTDDDILWLRAAAGSYVVEATENGRSAYRLYHQALAEHLRDHTNPQAVHRAFIDILTARVPYRPDGTRDWSRAHPYTLNHLVVHATAAGHLDGLLVDGDYLVHATPRSLTPHLIHARSQHARLAAAVYRTSFHLHATTTVTERRQVLALDAARAGAPALHQHLTHHIPPGQWTPVWATGSDFTPAHRDALTGHTALVSAVACTVVGGCPTAVTASHDATVRAWDLTTGEPVGQPLAGHTAPVTAVACTEMDERPVAVTGSVDKTVRLWDLRNGTIFGSPLTGHTDVVRAVACTMLDDRPVAVTGSVDTTVRVWDLTTGRQIGRPMAGHASSVSVVACTEVDGCPVAVTGSGDTTVRVWDLTTGEPVGRPLTGHTAPVSAVDCMVLGDGRPVAVTAAYDETVRVWDLATGKPFGPPLTRHTGTVTAMACMMLDGQDVAVAACSGNQTLQAWDVTTGKPVGQPLAGHADVVWAVACTVVDGRPVAVTGSSDRTARVWDLMTGDAVGRPPAGHSALVRAVACTLLDDRPIAVTASQDATVRLWDATSGKPVGQPLIGHTETVRSVACTEVDGRPIAVTGGSDATVRVWDLTTGKLMGRPIATNAGVVWAVACTVLDGRPVAVTGGSDRKLWVWDLETGKPVGQPLGNKTSTVNTVACTVLDGRPVAVTGGSDRKVWLWDLTTETPLGQLRAGHSAPVSAVACTVLDGRPVAVTGSSDATVGVWDLTDGTPVGLEQTGHTAPVTAVACTTMDGRPVAVTSSNDATVRAWDLQSGKAEGVIIRAAASTLAVMPDGDLVLGTNRDIAAFTRRQL
jgi:WD40 repeat protein